jgi:hypothetical protein
MLLEPFILLCGRAHPSPRCLLTVLRGSGAREIGFAKKVNEALRRFHLAMPVPPPPSLLLPLPMSLLYTPSVDNS